MTVCEVSASIQYALKSLGACSEAMEWARDKHSIQDLWDNCPDPEWLLLSLKAIEYHEPLQLRSFAVACVCRHVHLFPDDRFIEIIDVARAAIAGEAGLPELRLAFKRGRTLADDTSRHVNWSLARTAAICSLCDCVRSDPFDAARRASRNGRRAGASRLEEAEWQVDELRRILSPELPILIARARKLLPASSGMGPLRNRGASLEPVVQQHLEIASQNLNALQSAHRQPVNRNPFDEVVTRLAANLDGLVIANAIAVEVGMNLLDAGDHDSVGVLAILLSEAGIAPPSIVARPVDFLSHASPEVIQAARSGLRLSSPRPIESALRALLGGTNWDLPSAAALDILAFHRLPIHADILALRADESEEIAWLLAEAGGRMRGAWTKSNLSDFLCHDSPRVREAALRASARCGLPELPQVCRGAASCLDVTEAIEFLGVLGSPEDLALLQRAALTPRVASSAVTGLGRLGLPAGVSLILDLLELGELVEPAALAFWRITGQEVWRHPAPEPPASMTEDEIDLWEPLAPVDVLQTRAWWNANAARFDNAKRYQVGLNVSEDPLGPVFDRLPFAIRYDVYLRERALTPGTPDWELETWAWKQKCPS